MCKKKVLIIKLSSLGDVIFNIPLANILKANNYEVTWIVSEKGYDVIKNNSAVDEVILAPIKKWKTHKFKDNLQEYLQIVHHIRSKHFDIAIDTQGLLKSFIFMVVSGAKKRIVSTKAREFSFLGGNSFVKLSITDKKKHAIENYLKYAKHIGLRSDEIKVTLPPTEEKTSKYIDILLKDIDQSKPIVTICPATTWKTKHWNKDNWKDLIKLIGNEYNLIFTGTKTDNELIKYISEGKYINLAGKTSVLELIELFNRSNLVVSLDSGSTHLAWATQKPKIVMILCSTPAELYAPIGSPDKYITLSGALPCQPCHKRICPMDRSIQNQCTLYPQVDEVLTAIHKLLPPNIQ